MAYTLHPFAYPTTPRQRANTQPFFLNYKNISYLKKSVSTAHQGDKPGKFNIQITKENQDAHSKYLKAL